jgi:hypothetical protein
MTAPDSTPERQQGSRWWIAVAVIAALLIGGVTCFFIASPCLMIGALESPLGQAFAERQQAATAEREAATAEREIATASARRTLTAEAAIASATARADGWNFVIEDSFDDRGVNWTTHLLHEGHLISERAFLDGRYRWEMEALDEVFTYLLRGRYVATDFYLAVEADQVGGPDSSGYGLLFRVVDSGHFLYFGINESAGEFAFLKYYDGEWTPLIEPTYTPAIRQDGPNRLVVEADGLRYMLSINDRSVGEAEDDELVAGDVGLMVDLCTPHVTNVFEFDNFELRLP